MKGLFLCVYLIAAVTGQEQFLRDGTNVTEAGKWPFNGALFVHEDRPYCSIVLISQDWGLTTAGCVLFDRPDLLRFRFGSNSLTSGGKLYSPREIIIHEDFDRVKYTNDITVVKFNQPVTGENIASIPMAVNGSDHTGNNDCWIMGWGFTGTERPETLQEAKVTILSGEECSKQLPDKDHNATVCADGHPTCSHDEGGPLVCKVNGRYELVGDATGIFQNCDPDRIALYNRISYYRDWIHDKTGL